MELLGDVTFYISLRSKCKIEVMVKRLMEKQLCSDVKLNETMLSDEK